MKVWPVYWLVVIVGLSPVACGGGDPNDWLDPDGGTDAGSDGDGDGDTDGDTDADSDSDADPEDYYPLFIGANWTYEETDELSMTTTLYYEITGKEKVSFGNGVGEKTVYVLENTFPQNALEKRIQYIEDLGDRAVRHEHLVYEAGVLTKQRDFVPGFLRFDRTKLQQGDQWTETLDRYTDTKDGTPVEQETVSYRYEVLGLQELVEVPAGSFYCLQLRRTEVGTNEIKDYYFAKGIGKVKEITQGLKTEQLVDYD